MGLFMIGKLGCDGIVGMVWEPFSDHLLMMVREGFLII
jgi:hypothetical protein